MLLFIDESGDAGLKMAQGSSRYFVIALIVFEEHDEATACDQRIQLLKHELKLGDTEFHFKSLRTEQKTRFFEAVLPYSFFYFGIIINKDPNKLYGPGFKVKESFYKYTCSLVFENAKPYLQKTTVVIDGSGTREFKRQLERYLKRKIGSEVIRKVKVQDSYSNNLLQLADMVAGAIQRSLSNNTSHAKPFVLSLSKHEHRRSPFDRLRVNGSVCMSRVIRRIVRSTAGCSARRR